VGEVVVSMAEEERHWTRWYACESEPGSPWQARSMVQAFGAR